MPNEDTPPDTGSATLPTDRASRLAEWSAWLESEAGQIYHRRQVEAARALHVPPRFDGPPFAVGYDPEWSTGLYRTMSLIWRAGPWSLLVEISANGVQVWRLYDYPSRTVVARGPKAIWAVADA